MKIKGDGLDIEQLEALEESAAWSRIRGRLHDTLAASLRDLRAAGDMLNVARLQTKLETLEFLLQLPRQLIAEIRKSK